MTMTIIKTMAVWVSSKPTKSANKLRSLAHNGRSSLLYGFSDRDIAVEGLSWAAHSCAGKGMFIQIYRNFTPIYLRTIIYSCKNKADSAPDMIV